MKINDDTWELVSAMLTTLDQESTALAAALAPLMIAPESPLREHFYRLADALTAACGALVGDHAEDIDYFVFECDYGRKPKEAGSYGDMRLIDSLDRLRWLIELSAE